MLDGGSLAGNESATVLSNIFSRMPSRSSGSTSLSSGSLSVGVNSATHPGPIAEVVGREVASPGSRFELRNPELSMQEYHTAAGAWLGAEAGEA
jgi:hypothetical protein